MTFVDTIIPAVPLSPHFKFTDLTGKKTGYLRVISFQGRDQSNQPHWLCYCYACGRNKLIRTQKITKPLNPSCGCRNPGGKTTHGQTDTSVYRRWKAMRRRCLNPNDPAFCNYGGRGIKIAHRWNRFENFYADMGDPPNGMSLERRNNNEDYCPENCYWAPVAVQLSNTRRNVFLTLNGKTQTVAAWSRELHINSGTLHLRLRKGWSDEKTLTTPIRQHRPYLQSRE